MLKISTIDWFCQCCGFTSPNNFKVNLGLTEQNYMSIALCKTCLIELCSLIPKAVENHERGCICEEIRPIELE